MRYLLILLLIPLFVGVLSCGLDSDSDFNQGNSNSAIQDNAVNGHFIDDWTYSVNPSQDDNFSMAIFKLWIPEESDDVKAILVLLPTHNGSAEALFENIHWREYAANENLALLAVTMYTQRNEVGYINARGGSGRALGEAINKLADRNRINNLNSLKMLLRGYEVGGGFCISFSENYPEKVVAVASIRSGYSGEQSEKNLSIPVLISLGEFDIRLESISSLVKSKRKAEGLWAMAVEPGQKTSQSIVPTDNLIRSFFTSVLKKENQQRSS